MLMAFVVALTLIVIGIVYVRYVKKNHVPADEGRLTGLQKVLYHKYYVDEFYDVVIVKPLFWISKTTDTIIETLAIDGAVNLTGKIVTGSSNVLRKLQTGSIGFYIFIMVISIIMILTLTTLTGVAGQ